MNKLTSPNSYILPVGQGREVGKGPSLTCSFPQLTQGMCHKVPHSIAQEAPVWPFERCPRQSNPSTAMQFITFPFSISSPHFLPVSQGPMPVFRLHFWYLPNSALGLSLFRNWFRPCYTTSPLTSQTGLNIHPWLPSQGPACSKF